MNNPAFWCDDESRFIFQQRDMYSQTGDSRHIGFLCQELYRQKNGVSLETQITRSGKQLTIAFGCGAIGQRTVKTLSETGVDVAYFCDNSSEKWGTVCQSKKVISPQQLQQLQGEAFVIVTTSIPAYMRQIKEQLPQIGFALQDIAIPCETLGRQYFDFERLQPRATDHIFVDAGCFNGDDCLEFIRWSGNRYKGIYAFEPDPQNLAVCRNRLKDYTNVTLLPYALWSDDGGARFASSISGSSHVDFDEGTRITTVALDEQLEDAAVTYIKMDIEGAERNALKGAQKIIRSCRPQLAISLYHKPNDIYDIPQFLHELVPEYRFYLRHYSMCDLETVLYAVVE